MMKMKKSQFWVAALCGLLSAGFLSAKPQSFDFMDAKGVNNIAFELDAPLEAISGTGNGISGTVVFDPEDYTTTKGTIELDARTLKVTNSTMSEHLHGERWMGTEGYPTITFTVESIDGIEKKGENSFTAKVQGTMTIKGTTRLMSTEVKFDYLPGKLGVRSGGKVEGDLLVLRSTFSVKRSDFGINAGKNEDKVADEVVIRLALAGASPQ